MANKLITILTNPCRIFASLASKGKMSWVNDKLALKLIYRGQMGKKLHLKSPQTFNEKMQWLKLYDRNPLYPDLVDKHEVRKYISKWIGEEYLIPELGIWNSFDAIDFEKLPQQFVLKCTHDSGSAVVCRDKGTLDRNATRTHINNRLKRSHYWSGLEWPYKNIPHRISAEMFMSDNSGKGLTDYKFFCFNGEPKYLYISSGLEDHDSAYISFFDLDGNEMNFGRKDYRPFPHKVEMPENFEEMKKMAAILAAKINNCFVRVDLYNINGKIYFSEFTFTPCGGYMPFEPESFDLEMGKLLNLPIKDGK